MDGTSRQEQAARGLREEVQRRPRKMTPQLAREYGVPEVEVIRALHDNRAVELEITRREELIGTFEALGPVRVLASNGAAAMEAAGRFGDFSTTVEFFNVQTGSLDMHIRWRELAGCRQRRAGTNLATSCKNQNPEGGR